MRYIFALSIVILSSYMNTTFNEETIEKITEEDSYSIEVIQQDSSEIESIKKMLIILLTFYINNYNNILNIN